MTIDNNQKTIGDSIKKYRLQNKLTQEQLGELIGKSAISIRKYESNNVRPPLGVLSDLAKALKINVTDLIVDKSDPIYDDMSKLHETILEYGQKTMYCMENNKLHTIIPNSENVELIYNHRIKLLTKYYKENLEHKDNLIKLYEDRINKLECTINELLNKESID